MYIIINATKRETYRYYGNFPDTACEEMLDKGEDVIFISLYSNTVKVPRALSDEHVQAYRLDSKWEWTNFSLPKELMKQV